MDHTQVMTLLLFLLFLPFLLSLFHHYHLHHPSQSPHFRMSYPHLSCLCCHCLMLMPDQLRHRHQYLL
jgi:hypothetical protein